MQNRMPPYYGDLDPSASRNFPTSRFRLRNERVSFFYFLYFVRYIFFFCFNWNVKTFLCLPFLWWVCVEIGQFLLFLSAIWHLRTSFFSWSGRVWRCLWHYWWLYCRRWICWFGTTWFTECLEVIHTTSKSWVNKPIQVDQKIFSLFHRETWWF